MNEEIWDLLTFGTFKLMGHDATVHAVSTAIKAGFQRIDTAQVYQNELFVGEVTAEHKHVFVQTKISPRNVKTVQDIRTSIADSIKHLNGHVNSLLIHWPGTAKLDTSSIQNGINRRQTWRELERLYYAGTIQFIGVSNFNCDHLRPLFEHINTATEFDIEDDLSNWTPSVLPNVNQIELHPLLYHTQLPIIDYCNALGIKIESYSPLGSGSPLLLQNKTVLRIAQEHGVSSASVLLRWCIQHGWSVVVKCSSESHVNDCLKVWTFVLVAEEMLELNELEYTFGSHRFCWDSTHIA